ncbi:MAG TPA: hypothetical protein VMY37_02290 [Thermoguttaceae bacterium]|nr:hypothetical protein [Thermoguttaceae bacterium]
MIPLLLFAGCIVVDQLTTLTIHPDGSADLVIFGSNLHSTQTGEEGERELAEYRARFDSQSQDEMVRIREAGGKILQTSWIRQHAPLSNSVYVQLPDASVLEKFGTSKNDDGSLQITTQLQSEDVHRRLDIRITARPDTFDPSPLSFPDVRKLRQMFADGISETRVAVTSGSITKALGFTVASDGQSALLDLSETAKILQTSGGKAELYLEWEVTK